MSGARALRNSDWEWAVEDQQATKMSFVSPYFQAPVEDELCSILEAKMNLEKKQQAGGLEGKDAFDLQELSQALEVKKQAGGCTEDTLLSLMHGLALTNEEEKAEVAEKNQKISSLLERIIYAEQVDLAFLIDATASMDPYLLEVKKEVENIVASVRRTNPNLRLRIAMVAYRDVDYPVHLRYEIKPFVHDLDEFRGFLNKIEALANFKNDFAEDVAGGLDKICHLDWQSPTRILFHTCDSPAHGRKYHGQHYDDYPNGDPGGLEIRNLLGYLIKNRVDYYFGRLNQYTDVMIREFNKEMAYGKQQEDYIREITIKQPDRLGEAVKNVVRESVALTYSGSRAIRDPDGPAKAAMMPAITEDDEEEEEMKADKSVEKVDDDELDSFFEDEGDMLLKDFTIDTGDVQATHYRAMQRKKVKVYGPAAIPSVEALTNPLFRWGRAKPSDGSNFEEMQVRINKNPFAEGNARIAYYGKMNSLGGPKNYIYKEFKHVQDKSNVFKRYLQQMEVSAIANYLALAFNQTPERSANGWKMVKCNVVKIVEVEDPQTSGLRYYTMEPPLVGSFTKYSNNTGYWNMDFFNETLARFSKYTYDVTGGYLMVVDLQGVLDKGGRSYTLTDPVILCKDIRRFGENNLGDMFMERCMESIKAHLKLQ